MVTKNFLKNTKGILYCSPKGGSEYAEAGKRMVYELNRLGIPVAWIPLITDDFQTDDTDFIYQSIKPIINKDISYDTVILHCNPDVSKKYLEKHKVKFSGKKIIGYVSWETTEYPDKWLDFLSSFHEVWVPSKFIKKSLDRSNLKKDVKVVPYSFIEMPLPEINSESLTKLLSISRWYGSDSNLFRYGADWKIYYTSGEWNELKNIDDTIKTFCKAFTIEDRVKLIVKTFHSDYTKKNISACIVKLETLLKEFPNHPEILLITKELTSTESLFLHSISDCYFSMTRGEGFGLDIFDAYKYKKSIVVPKFSGYLDFMGNTYKGLIDCDLIDVRFPEKSEFYLSPQKWADAHVYEAMDRIKSIYLSDDTIEPNSPIILKSGWYFKEKKENVVFRQSSGKSVILFNDNTYDYARLKLMYETGKPNKEVELVLDSFVKKNVNLDKGVVNEVLIPCNNIKKLEIQTDCDIPNDYQKTLWDSRKVGVIIRGIELIKGDMVKSFSIDEIYTENELTDFYITSNKDRIENNLSKEIEFFEVEPNSNINLVKLEVLNSEDFLGISYIGQYGTSGYAAAAKGNLCHFFTKGIPITWIPLYFDNSQLSEDCFYNAMVRSLINKPIEYYDSVFIHATADIWPNLMDQHQDIVNGKKIIGYSVWETSQLPYEWVENINKCVEEVWCPSTYNQAVFKNSGVEVPIKVFPHVFLKKELPNRESVVLKPYGNSDDNILTEKKVYTFYNISELNPRKGVEDLVKVFCDAFTSKDNVRLILKVHYKNYDEKNKKYCIKILRDIVSKYKKPPEIYYILSNMSEKEILGLHSIGDCYVSLCKSEGFGLTIFEAFKYGKKIIATGYGGQLDFLGKEYEGLVQYKLGKIKGMETFSKYYTDDQQWAYPVLDHAKELLKLAVK